MIVLMSLLFWLAIVVAVEACTEIIVASSLFFSFRDWFSRPEPEEPCTHNTTELHPCKKINSFKRFGWWLRHKIGELVNCGHCASVWVAAIASYCTGFTSVWMFAIKTLVIHRVSNIVHELFKRWFDRSPFSLVITHINNKEE